MNARQAITEGDHSAEQLDFSIKLMEHLVVPTFVLDAECRVIIWNRACERLTGVTTGEVIGTRDHRRAFYDTPRPCLADLVARGRTAEIDALYADHDHNDINAVAAHGRKAENWCVMPQKGTRLYLAIDAGPIYDESGKLIAEMETLCDMTAQKEAQTELQRLAACDGLTGLANRRSFDETLRREWLRGLRDATSLSLILIDVDHFRRYNESFGHLGGDVCLKTIATTMMTSCMRSADLVARYGGEEFAVILPDTAIGGAITVAERVRKDIAALAMPHPGNEDYGYVSISAGVATMVPYSAVEIQELIETADRALYAAKEAGRNRSLHIDQIQAKPRLDASSAV